MGLGNMRPKGHFWKVAPTQNYGIVRPAFFAAIGNPRQLFLVIGVAAG